LDWDGNAWFAGEIMIGLENNKILSTKKQAFNTEEKKQIRENIGLIQLPITLYYSTLSVAINDLNNYSIDNAIEDIESAGVEVYMAQNGHIKVKLLKNQSEN
jgi:hypothetical protein